MKKIALFILVSILLISIFAGFAYAENTLISNEVTEPKVIPQHRVTIQWIFEPNASETAPPFTGALIGSYSFSAYEGDSVDMSSYMSNPVGASSPSAGAINYNGITCYLYLTCADGGRGIDANGNPIDGLAFDFDPFGNLTMPGTDVTIYYLYAPYYRAPDVPDGGSLDKIAIYVNQPSNDINPVRQEYRVYEIFHVGKAPTVVEDVTNDSTVGQDVLPTDTGFAYWISSSDAWFGVVSGMTDYFVLTETTTEGYYIVELNSNMPSNEETAKAIARYLEEHIPDGAPAKIVTADVPSYDNDPGYYLIVSDINSNLILGTSNIAITEKAEYPNISKTVNDVNSGIGEVVTFTVTSHFPQGSKADAIFSDVMTDGLTFVEGSLSCNVEYSLAVGASADGNAVNGFTLRVDGEVIKSLAAGEGGGDVSFSYNAIVNEKALISSTSPNVNSVRLDFSHWSQQATANVFVTSFTLLKYSTADETKAPLEGAHFKLLNANKEPISLVVVKNNKEYRIATSNDDSAAVVDEFITGDSIILIQGLDAENTYYLREVQAPNGYNLLANDVAVSAAVNGSTVIQVPNGQGTLLPSTGGIGTTIFYIVGTILAVVGAILFISKKKVDSYIDD